MAKQEKRPLVLLLGNYRPALILARKLHRQGFAVMVGSHGCEQLCQHSKTVDLTWDHSALENGPSVLAAELKALSQQLPELVAIFPVAEEYVRLIAENDEFFEDLPFIISMESKLVQKCLDKEYMLNLAKSIGVPTAQFAYTASLSETLAAANRSVSYPLVIRPKDSTKRIDGNKAICVGNGDEIIDRYNKHDLHNEVLLLQRKFEGKRHNVYFAAIDGKATRLLHAVIDRTDKPDGTGLAVDGRTLDTNHPVVAQTKNLLTALNYSGIGCAQFLVDQNTGETSFLEINPRIAGNHALPEFAGLDLTGFNFNRILLGEEDHREIIAGGGLRYCWTTGDLMGAKVAFLRKEIGIGSLLSWSIQAIITAIRSDLHMVFTKSDPYPAIQGLWKTVPRLARWRQSKAQTEQFPIHSDKQRRTT